MSQFPGSLHPTPKPTPDRSAALRLVAAPAICLMIVGGLDIGVCLLSLALNLLGMGLGAAEGGSSGGAAMLQGGVGLFSAAVGVLWGSALIFGATQLKGLKSHKNSMAVTIMAMLPCFNPCCLLGLPFGIWSLIVLLKPEVREAFPD